MKLVKFNEVNEEEYIEYIKEWEENGERIVPWSSKRENRTFQQMLDKWNEDETEVVIAKGFVPSTLFFLLNENAKIIGAIHFRHFLNDKLLNEGGHIGYGIRKSERKNGYASLMLNLLLEKIKDSVDRVLLTCDDDNFASIKTIERANGILNEKKISNEVLIRNYWINLKEE